MILSKSSNLACSPQVKTPLVFLCKLSTQATLYEYSLSLDCINSSNASKSLQINVSAFIKEVSILIKEIVASRMIPVKPIPPMVAQKKLFVLPELF